MRRKHQNLLAWQQAIELVKLVYKITSAFPQHEIYGLTSQMRRAAISVPANLAEGAGRNSKKEFVQYLVIARGSLSELDTLVVIATEIGYFHEPQEMRVLTDRLFGLIGGLINSERRASAP